MATQRTRALREVLSRHFPPQEVEEALSAGIGEELRAMGRSQGWAEQPVDLSGSRELGLVVLCAGGEVRIPLSVRTQVARHGVRVWSDPATTDTITLKAELTDEQAPPPGE